MEAMIAGGFDGDSAVAQGSQARRLDGVLRALSGAMKETRRTHLEDIRRFPAILGHRHR
jgi:hypothetical protein